MLAVITGHINSTYVKCVNALKAKKSNILHGVS